MNFRLFAIALTAVFAMSLVPVLVRSVGANEVTIGAIRIGIALLFLTPILLVKGTLKGLSFRDWLGMALVGLMFAAHWWTYFYAIKNSSAALGAISLSTYGIHLVIISWAFGGHKLAPIDLCAVAVSFTGCILVTPELNFSNETTWGFTVGVFSGLLYALLPLIHQRMAHIPTMTRSWGQFAFAGLFFLMLWPQIEWPRSSGDWWPLAVMGIVSTLIGHTLWVKASTELPAIVTSTTYYFYIPIAMVLSFVFLDEEITPIMIAGASMIVGANIAMAVMPVLKHRGLKNRTLKRQNLA